MEIKVWDTSNPTQLAIIGRVDTVTADEFLKTMEGILQEHLQDMEWDCAEWKFLSSAGLRVLFILVKKTKMLKATITLKHLEKNVYEVLKISGFTSFLKIVDWLLKAESVNMKKRLSAVGAARDAFLVLRLFG